MSEHHGHHIIPRRLLTTIFLILVGLTAFTVFTAQFDFGSWNIPIALAIAGTKAVLVVTFFMALKYDAKVNTLVFSVSTIFVLVFLSFTLFDTAFRGDMGNVAGSTISDMEREEEALRAREPDPALLRFTPADYLRDPAPRQSEQATEAAGLGDGDAAEDATPDPNAELIALGAQLYTGQICNTCHTTDGTPGVGPTFKGLYGKTEMLTNGTSVRVDDAYLITSIVEPNATIVQGYPAAMPDVYTGLTPEELNALVAFIKAQE